MAITRKIRGQEQAQESVIDVRPLMSIEEVAFRISQSYETAKKLIRTKQIPSVQIGRSVLVRPGSLDKWLREQEQGGTPL